jgi:hypothetical protein
LNKYADKVDLGYHAALKAAAPPGSGKRVNFLSDAWENIAKTHILGVILSFASLCVTFGTFTCGSRHDGLAIAEHLESILLLMIAQGWDVGAIVTYNVGNCARARRILALRWPKIVFLFCYAHQINLLVKDVIATSWKITVSQAHTIVSTLNKSTAKWLPRLRDVMKATYENTVTLALVQMADTRWNSVQGMLALLLRVRSACKMFVLRWSSHVDFPNDLYALDNDTFWKECEDAEALIKPLMIASFRLQRDQNTMADVVMNYGAIFLAFYNHPENALLVPCIENRWHDCEQPLFILALFLHPQYRSTFKKIVDETPLTSLGQLCTFAIFYYTRFIDENIGQLRDEVLQWWETGSPAYGVADPEELAGPLRFWDFVKFAFKGSCLARLALIILSIVTNMATCERLFSKLAQIHTARRNRLKPDKVKKLSIVRQAVRKKNAIELQSQEVSASTPGRIIEAKERKILGVVDDGDQENIVDVRMEEERVEQKEDDQEQDGEEEKEEEPVEESESIDHVLFEWSSILGLGMREADANDDERFEVVEEKQVRQPWPTENVPNWPQEPTLTKLTGLRGTKVLLGSYLL